MFGFDIFGPIAEALKNFYLQMVGWFQSLLISPPTLVGSSFRDYLYGNALGIYHYLAISIAYVTFILALFFTKKRVNFLHALMILVVLAIIGPVWFSIMNQFDVLGDELTKASTEIYVPPAGQNQNILPPLNFADAFATIILLLPTILWALSLYVTFAGYELVSTLVQFSGLIVLSLWALGDRVKKVFSMLVSAGIVTIVLGRPVAMLFIELGQGFVATLSGASGTMIFIGAITIMSLFLALLSQILLVFLTYHAVSPIVGKVIAAVSGTVEAINIERFRLTNTAINEAYTQSLQGRSQAIENRPSTAGTFAREAAATGVALGAAKLAAKAAASAHPAVGAAASIAITAGGKAIQSRASKPRPGRTTKP
jgi:hypothetical protein